MDESDIKAITEHLNSLGCSLDEIKQVLKRLHKYDQQMIHESVFDSIASGSFNLNAILQEVRERDESTTGLA